jgi:predicted HicB family RNase H-like nuclease
MLWYNGNAAAVGFDDEVNLFHGQAINIRDVITFQGRSMGALREEFKHSVEHYLELCAERAEPPEEPLIGSR